LLGAAARVFSVASSISVDKEWATVVSGGDEDKLSEMNGIMRRIDLFCKLVAPALTGVGWGFVGGVVGTLVVSVWNCLSYLAEVRLLEAVFASVQVLEGARRGDRKRERGEMKQQEREKGGRKREREKADEMKGSSYDGGASGSLHGGAVTGEQGRSVARSGSIVDVELGFTADEEGEVEFDSGSASLGLGLKLKPSVPAVAAATETETGTGTGTGTGIEVIDASQVMRPADVVVAEGGGWRSGVDLDLRVGSGSEDDDEEEDDEDGDEGNDA